MIARPAADEYAPFYETYISKVPPGTDVQELLAAQQRDTTSLLTGLTDAQAAHRYAPGKWTVREVIGHVTDAERIFAYRLLCIARGEAASLPGFDENGYAATSNCESRPIAKVAAEYALVRSSTLALLDGLDAEALARRGLANSYPVTARALAFVIAGHERHHYGVLRERYLGR